MVIGYTENYNCDNSKRAHSKYAQSMGSVSPFSTEHNVVYGVVLDYIGAFLVYYRMPEYSINDIFG